MRHGEREYNHDSDNTINTTLNICILHFLFPL